jgi:hypothetical protein
MHRFVLQHLYFYIYIQYITWFINNYAVVNELSNPNQATPRISI